MAFIPSLPAPSFTSSNSFLCRPRPRHSSRSPPRRPRGATLACAIPPDPQNPAAPPNPLPVTSTEKPPSQTERMAALLGRDVAADASRQRAEAEALSAANAKEKRQSWAIFLAATVTGFLLALAEAKTGTGTPENLMAKMAFISPAPAVVGTNGRVSLIDVGATWCENCKAAAPAMFDFARSPTASQANVLVLDADDAKNAEIIERYHIDGIPQYTFLDKKGVVKGVLVGQVPISIIRDDLEALLDGKDLPFPGILEYDFENDK